MIYLMSFTTSLQLDTRWSCQLAGTSTTSPMERIGLRYCIVHTHYMLCALHCAVLQVWSSELHRQRDTEESCDGRKCRSLGGICGWYKFDFHNVVREKSFIVYKPAFPAIVHMYTPWITTYFIVANSIAYITGHVLVLSVRGCGVQSLLRMSRMQGRGYTTIGAVWSGKAPWADVTTLKWCRIIFVTADGESPPNQLKDQVTAYQSMIQPTVD